MEQQGAILEHLDSVAKLRPQVSDDLCADWLNDGDRLYFVLLDLPLDDRLVSAAAGVADRQEGLSAHCAPHHLGLAGHVHAKRLTWRAERQWWGQELMEKCAVERVFRPCSLLKFFFSTISPQSYSFYWHFMWQAIATWCLIVKRGLVIFFHFTHKIPKSVICLCIVLSFIKSTLCWITFMLLLLQNFWDFVSYLFSDWKIWVIKELKLFRSNGHCLS